MKKLPTILLSQSDIEYIAGKQWKFFKENILTNCCCHTCRENDRSILRTIVDYTIHLNDLNDIMLSGMCKTCGNKIGRYLEIGESIEKLERIKKVRGELLVVFVKKYLCLTHLFKLAKN